MKQVKARNRFEINFTMENLQEVFLSNKVSYSTENIKIFAVTAASRRFFFILESVALAGPVSLVKRGYENF